MRRLLVLALFSLCTVANAASEFVFSNAPGPYAVGLKLTQQYDFSRAYKGRIDTVSGQSVQDERARPIQSLTWYPAVKGGKPMQYGDYMRTAFTEDAFGRSEAQVKEAMAQEIADRSVTLGAQGAERLVRKPMWAVRDAVAAPGKFPVVIYAPSFNASAYENTDLCEFLASHGYLVIASADMGAYTRRMTADLEGIEAAAGDIAFLIAQAHALPQADTKHIAVIGYSWGGIANVFAAAKDSRIGAVVSLDGSVRYYPKLVKAAGYVTPTRLALPFLFVARRSRSLEELNKRNDDMSSNLLNQMTYSDVYVATMQPMVHSNFSSQGLRYAPDASFEEYTREEVSLAHSWTARYVQRFLDAYLKNDAASLAFMRNTPAANGAPAHMISLESHRAESNAPTLENFVGDVAKRGFEHVADSYQDIRKRDASFELADFAVNSWAYALLRSGKGKEAIEVFKFGTTLYPDNGNLFDSLADCYEQQHEKALAIKNYRRSLELDPKNENAVQHLIGLGVADPRTLAH